MKKTYIVIIVLILVILGVWFFVSSQAGENNYSYSGESANTSATPAPANTEPAPPADSGAKVDLNTSVKIPPVTSKVKEFTVSGQNFSFTPSLITVKKGDTVKITFKNLNGTHNFLIDEFAVNSGMVASGTAKTVQFVADKTGSFQYYCSVGSHRAMGMWGTLKVE